MKKYNIAVIGATGLVGRETLDILATRNFPYANVVAVASDNSIGKKVSFGDQNLHIDLLDDVKWDQIDIIFASAGSRITKMLIDKLPKNCILIDKTTAYRLDPDVPLIVPELNRDQISLYSVKNIIANPNCCVIPIALTLKPLNDFNPIKRVVISTYQSVSGAGKNAIENLYNQTKNKFIYLDQDNNEEDVNQIQKTNFAFNIIPEIGKISENGYTDEENKIILELNRLLTRQIAITVTSVRVPVFIGHCFSVNIEFENPFNLIDLEKVLRDSPGLEVSNQVITPTIVSGTDKVHISRLRADNSLPNAVNLWITSDNLRKGAALNAVQIAEHLISML